MTTCLNAVGVDVAYYSKLAIASGNEDTIDVLTRFFFPQAVYVLGCL